MRVRSTLLALVLAAVLPASAARAVSNFNFDAQPAGTTTTFSETSNSITATFSSTTGLFYVVPTPFGGGFSGKDVQDTDTSPNANIPLIITFSQSVHTFDFIYSTDDHVSGSASTLHTEAYLGGTLKGSFDDTGVYSFFGSQGTAGHNPGFSFDKLILSDVGAPAFAIDSLTVIPDAVAAAPLPSSAAAGLGLLSALAVVAAGKRFLRQAGAGA